MQFHMLKIIPVLSFTTLLVLLPSITYTQEITVFDGYYVDDLMASSIALKYWEKAIFQYNQALENYQPGLSLTGDGSTLCNGY